MRPRATTLAHSKRICDQINSSVFDFQSIRNGNVCLFDIIGHTAFDPMENGYWFNNQFVSENSLETMIEVVDE